MDTSTRHKVLWAIDKRGKRACNDGKAFILKAHLMILSLRKGLSAVATAAMLVMLVPSMTLASTLSAPGNVDINGGIYTNDTTPTATWDRPSGATWYEFLLDNGNWQSIGNVNSYTLWPLANGWHTFYVRAHNNLGNISPSASVTFEIDTQGPTVTAVSPSTAVEDIATTFTVTTAGESATTFCNFYVDGASVGGMTKYSSTSFKISYTFAQDDTYTVYARCADGDGNYTTGPSITMTVTQQDDEPSETFYVNDVSPTSATEDESETFRVTTSGTLDADTCVLYVSGSSVGTMSETSANSFSKSYTFTNSGSYTVYAYCEDEHGNWERGDSVTVTVDDDETFSVPTVSPSTAIEDEEVTFSVTPTGTLDAETCKLYVSNAYVGTMSESNGTFRLDYTFNNDGSYSVYAYCEDEHGDWEKGTTRTVTVSHETEELDVPAVTPSSTDEDVRTEFTVRPTSDHNITECWLYVDDSRVATMTEESTNVFTAYYTFTSHGYYTVYAYCKDSSGDTDSGTKRTVTVYHDNDSSANHGDLIKTPCTSGATSLDPCKAVYYYGEDGMRHVFPNEATYFTWYNDFDDVIEVSTSYMASLTIGKNVTVRPGSVLVQFESWDHVFAVESPHTLRHYLTPSLVQSDYGSDWGDDLITLSDSLYGNYSLGNDIDSSSDYDASDEYYGVDTIDDIL